MDFRLLLLSKHRNAIMGFAILWVMLFHLPGHIGFWPFNFLKSIGYGGVDIFLFLSGFGLYYSMSKDNFNLKQYWKRRFSRIMPEFWTVLVAVFLIRMDFSRSSFFDLIIHASTLAYWILGKGELWYISCIMLFYVLYPYYFKLFKRYGIRVPLIAIGIAFVLIISYAIICVVFFNRQNVLGLAVLTIARISIFILGSVFALWAKYRGEMKLSRNLMLFGFISALCALVALYQFMRFFPDCLWSCSLFFIPFIVITPFMCVLLAMFFDKFVFSDVVFGYIGLMSLELYMCHEYSYQLFDHFVYSWGNVMAYVLVLLLSVMTAYLLYFMNKMILQKITL